MAESNTPTMSRNMAAVDRFLVNELSINSTSECIAVSVNRPGRKPFCCSQNQFSLFVISMILFRITDLSTFPKDFAMLIGRKLFFSS